MWTGKGTLPQGQARCLECRRANPRRSTTVCIDCGAVKKTNQGPRCRRCANIALNRNRGPGPKTHQCAHCGQKFRRKKTGKHDTYTYCSFACYNQSRGAVERFPASPVKFGKCLHCQAWHRRIRNSQHCSDLCRMQRQADRASVRVMDLYRMACGLGFGSAKWRKLLVDALRERDGDLCCLCWRPIDFTVKSGTRGSDQGYSIEHLTPRSWFAEDNEGRDAWDNLALSHWGCNRARKTADIEVLWRAS